MDIKNLKRDLTASQEGQWVSDIPEMGQLRLKVRGDNGARVADVRQRKLRAVPRDKRDRSGNPVFSELLRITAELLYEEILLDWDGLTDGGKPVKYDADLAKEWLTNPEYQDFAEAVAWASKVVANGNDRTAEQVEGN